MLASDAAWFVVLVGSERADPTGIPCRRSAQCFEELVARGVTVEFRLEIFELFGGDLLSFGVAEQAIAASNDVTDVKCDGWKSVRTSIELFVRKLRAPTLDIFDREFECVKNRALHGRDIGECAAHPGFWLASGRNSNHGRKA